MTRVGVAAAEQDWREVLLRRVLLVTTPLIALTNVVSILSSSGRERWLRAEREEAT